MCNITNANGFEAISKSITKPKLVHMFKCVPDGLTSTVLLSSNIMLHAGTVAIIWWERAVWQCPYHDISPIKSPVWHDVIIIYNGCISQYNSMLDIGSGGETAQSAWLSTSLMLYVGSIKPHSCFINNPKQIHIVEWLQVKIERVTSLDEVKEINDKNEAEWNRNWKNDDYQLLKVLPDPKAVHIFCNGLSEKKCVKKFTKTQITATFLIFYKLGYQETRLLQYAWSSRRILM